MKRAMIMPLVFGVLFILLITGYGFLFFLVPIPLAIKIIIALAVLGIAAAMVYLLVQRNREIKEEERSDLSKY